MGADTLAWIFGLTNAVMAAIGRPDFLDELLDVIFQWNRTRMEIMLEPEPDLFIRRGWYEGTSSWLPALFQGFLLPRLRSEAKLAHEAGSRFGYIMTVGAKQLAQPLIQSGVDVVIGVDDVQDHGMSLTELKQKLRGRIALWGVSTASSPSRKAARTTSERRPPPRSKRSDPTASSSHPWTISAALWEPSGESRLLGRHLEARRGKGLAPGQAPSPPLLKDVVSQVELGLGGGCAEKLDRKLVTGGARSGQPA